MVDSEQMLCNFVLHSGPPFCREPPWPRYHLAGEIMTRMQLGCDSDRARTRNSKPGEDKAPRCIEYGDQQSPIAVESSITNCPLPIIRTLCPQIVVPDKQERHETVSGMGRNETWDGRWGGICLNTFRLCIRLYNVLRTPYRPLTQRSSEAEGGSIQWSDSIQRIPRLITQIRSSEHRQHAAHGAIARPTCPVPTRDSATQPEVHLLHGANASRPESSPVHDRPTRASTTTFHAFHGRDPRPILHIHSRPWFV